MSRRLALLFALAASISVGQTPPQPPPPREGDVAKPAEDFGKTPGDKPAPRDGDRRGDKPGPRDSDMRGDKPGPRDPAQPLRDGDRRRPFGPPGPPMPGDGMPGGPPRDKRDGKGWPFTRGYQNEAWDRLPEADKQRVRSAFDAAWERPEVAEARDRAMRANAEVREALMKAMQSIDPQAHKLALEVRPEFPALTGSFKPPMPRPEDPNFPAAAIVVLRQAVTALAKPEHREAAGKLHDKVMQRPDVLEARQVLDTTPSPEGRAKAFAKLHMIYRKALEYEFSELRRRQAEKSAEPKADKKP